MDAPVVIISMMCTSNLVTPTVVNQQEWRFACLARVPKDYTGARLHNVEGFSGLALAYDHLPSIEDARLQRCAQL